MQRIISYIAYSMDLGEVVKEEVRQLWLFKKRIVRITVSEEDFFIVAFGNIGKELRMFMENQCPHCIFRVDCPHWEW